MRKWVVVSSDFVKKSEQHWKWRFNWHNQLPSPIDISLDIDQLFSNP